ncbi:MAG: hypothetical protein U9N45_06435 [Gemmatimonadota bacterium]|nr:hypothetical protein [Gemmatimonadota bacterium]
MTRTGFFLFLGLAPAILSCGKPQEPWGGPARDAGRGATVRQAIPGCPDHFPGRIWAACDFEQSRKDVLWTGLPETADIPAYPGNTTALRAVPVGREGTRSLVVKPADYPRMSRESRVYFRYYLEGASSVSLQILNLDKKSFHELTVTGLTTGAWAEATVDLSGVPASGAGDGDEGGSLIAEGERMDGLVIYAEPAEMGASCELMVDDVIFFSDSPGRHQAKDQPFPRRVIYIRGFDVVDNYHPWTHENYRVIRKGEHLENDWGVACALKHPKRPGKRVRLIIDPPQAVGESTRMRFRYRLEGASKLQVQIFDLSDMDNRHIVIPDAGQGRWQWAVVDFTADGIKNDGIQTPFKPGNLVDDIFFLPGDVQPGSEVELLIDEVVLYDAGR